MAQTSGELKTPLGTETVFEPDFVYIDPPFVFNAPTVSKFPTEVTGNYMLQTLCRRIGWTSLKGKRLLDFGCGVRFATTIINLGIEIELYAGVDVNKDAISWLRQNVDELRFRFEHLDMQSPMYNPGGLENLDEAELVHLGLTDFDAASMFSVITHQSPPDAAKIFGMLYQCVSEGGALYFTAFTDEKIDDYKDLDPVNRCLCSVYNPKYLTEIVENSGWTVYAVFPPSKFQQTAFICRK